MNRPIRNIAIIAHVDHGKTTLVDCLLRQSGTFAAHERLTERVMDSNDIERERGITILAKNCAIEYGGTRINIVDTPGHADFGGEVERVLSMVDGVLLLVDAVEGPMPQTRFVTRKALALGLKAIVVVNKIDRPGARPGWVVDQTFELFDKLGASDEQLDFPVIYASALQGWAGTDHLERRPDMSALFEAILKHVPPPAGEPRSGERPATTAGPGDLPRGTASGTEPLQLQISTLDYNSYVGRIGIGRIRRGSIRPGQQVVLRYGAEDRGSGKIGQVLSFTGLERRAVEEASAGDIVAITGIEDVNIGLTICDPQAPEGLPPIRVDEPTLAMNFQVNSSPFSGREGKFVTSRQIRERLYRELQSNVALRVEDTDEPDVFRVSGRGELHLTILIENMRREGYELAVSRPQVLTHIVDGEVHEPYEALTVDVDDTHQGAVMEALGARRAELTDMAVDGNGRVRLDYRVPARGLIGFQGEFLTLTRGTGLMSHIFDGFAPVKGDIPDRHNGVLVSNEQGEAVAYALFNLQERGRLFVSPGEKLYEGMIIGIHSRDNDLVVNPIKTKKLTNIRAAGKDDAILLTPPIPLTLEYAVEFIADDELVEVTPASIRIRKRFLKEQDRKRAERQDVVASA
ncbi:MAG TPA: GTP-binding protein TypA [Steroidobacteraceae bacterium]|nr:GTP-binding protein TypA [Steroidobacteraceae bacterium]